MTYNKKLSGAKAVFVTLTKLGKNYLPYIEDLKHRCIKFIDFYPCQYLPETTAAGLTTTDNCYLTLADHTGNMLYIKDMPLARFNYAETTGTRQPVFNEISLQNSYITVTDQSLIGKTAMLIFWYDLPDYSRSNKSDLCITDSLTVPVTTSVRHNTLPDEERMAQKRFRRILLGINTIAPDYSTSLTVAQMQNVYLTLRKGTYNVIENLPVMLLLQLTMYDKAEFANIVFDLQNSYLTIGGAGTIPNVDDDYVGKTVTMNFAYEKQ